MRSIDRPSDSFLGHPKGLAYIVFAEAWERFSFYGMQALLVLYMANHLLLPGNVESVIGFEFLQQSIANIFGELTINALATQLFGIYVGLIYLMPVFGGLIGDRILGRTRSVFYGAILMASGHFLMAFEAYFLIALILLIFGSGLLKGNLAAQVGNLYQKGDQRRDAAFSMYSIAINVGGFVAPLVCGTLGELYGWHYGFAGAGIGMLIGIYIYILGRRYLPVEISQVHTTPPKLEPDQRKIVVALIGILLITSLYWIAQAQIWNSYPLWISDNVDRKFNSFLVPVTWFQSLDMFAVLTLAPFVLLYWRKQRKVGSEPNGLKKIALGSAIFSLACFWLALGESTSKAEVSLFWPFFFHFICALGYLYIGPVALALVSQCAPASVNAMMMGAYYLAIFLGGLGSGFLGRFYDTLSATEFWIMHGCIVGLATMLILLLYRPLFGLLQLQEPVSKPIDETLVSSR